MTVRTLGSDEHATSPVIGVILMVAITVVMASVVFTISAGISSNQVEKPPSMMFIANEGANELQLVSVRGMEFPLYWHTTDDETSLQVNGCTSVNGLPLDGKVIVSAGDILSCDPGHVTIVHPKTNQLVYQTTFS